jgi:hypothetical protein
MKSFPYVKKIFIVPTIIAASSGGIYGGYKAFIKTKNQEYHENVIYSLMGMSAGAAYGGVVGFLWPITSLVYVGRIICNKEEKEKEKEKETAKLNLNLKK